MSSGMKVFGALERKDKQRISGWFATLPSNLVHQVLEILIDNKVIGRVKADQFREDVKAAGFGAGESGFSFQFPPDIDAEDAARARIRLLGTELYLDCADLAPKAQREEPPPPGTGSVFILGPARSGTSILFLALQSVFEMSGLGEGHVFPIFQRMHFAYYEYVRQFLGQEGVLASRLDVTDLKTRMIATIRRFYFDQFAGSPFIDKTPGVEALTSANLIKLAFPGAKIIVTNRNGVEVVESYRRKFKADFRDACLEWARCAKEIARLKISMPEALILDQNVMRATPEIVAEKIAGHLGRPERAVALAEFMRSQRVDVLSQNTDWATPLTLDTIGWTEEEKAVYRVIDNSRKA